MIIAGLPRTGSTLLFNLLAQDPDSRALRNWEMFKPLPPPTRQTVTTDPRIDQVRKLQRLVSRPKRSVFVLIRRTGEAHANQL